MYTKKYENSETINLIIHCDIDHLMKSYLEVFNKHDVNEAFLEYSINNISRYIARSSICSTGDIFRSLDIYNEIIKKKSIEITKRIIKEDD